MKVVITGGTGFIGTNLMQHLEKTEPDTEIVLVDLVPPCVTMGPKTRFVFADIRNLACLIQAFEDADEVYNLAGILGTSELLQNTSLAVDVNVLGCNNVLDAARICKVKRVYNVAKPFFSHMAENPYTLTKHAAELLGIMYREKFGMDVATVRWMDAVGPHQHLFPVRKFVPSMILFALYGVDLEIYGTGKQTIDPIDARDLSRFTVHACRHLGQHPEVVDLGQGVAISCNEAAETMLNAVKKRGFGTQSEIKHVPMRPGQALNDLRICANTSYWDKIGMRAEISFAESVDAILDYILELPESHRRNALQFHKKSIRHGLTYPDALAYSQRAA